MGENAERLLRMVTPSVPDQQLLDLIIQAADETSFTELVRRHGPMVLGVCRRVLKHEQDAEDAFQATFLVLTKRAASLRNRQSLGAWLFGVARHVALRLRDKNHRRNRHEREPAKLSAVESAEPDREGWLTLLEEELHRLPDKYKAPLIASHLLGRTQEETANELRLSLSTLRRRLEYARELLRERLMRRGVGLPICLSSLASLSVVLPAGFAETTSRAAVAFIMGERGTAPAVLAQGVLTMMTQVKLKMIAGAVLTLAVGAGMW
jgi:polysaccharide export outer membrane protein